MMLLLCFGRVIYTLLCSPRGLGVDYLLPTPRLGSPRPRIPQPRPVSGVDGVLGVLPRFKLQELMVKQP